MCSALCRVDPAVQEDPVDLGHGRLVADLHVPDQHVTVEGGEARPLQVRIRRW